MTIRHRIQSFSNLLGNFQAFDLEAKDEEAALLGLLMVMAKCGI